MRRIIIAIILVGQALSPQCKKDSGIMQGVVDFTAGEVNLVSAAKIAPARVGDAVLEGMKIHTGERSYARVSFGNGMIQVYEKTHIDFTSLARAVDKERDTTEMAMEKGMIFCRVALKLTGGDSYRVSSETMIAAVRGTEFLYAVDGTRGVVACYRGVLSVRRAGSDEEVILRAGQMLSIGPGRKMKPVPVPAGFRYRDFEYGSNSYERGEGPGEKNAVINEGPEQEKTGRTAEKDRSAITAQKNEPAAVKKDKDSTGSAGKKSGSGTKDGAVAADKKGNESEKKEAYKPGTAIETKSDGKKSTTLTGAGRERKPFELLVKPRVEDPEVK